MRLKLVRCVQLVCQMARRIVKCRESSVQFGGLRMAVDLSDRSDPGHRAGRAAAGDGTRTVGTGFLISDPTPDGTPRTVLVTANHVFRTACRRQGHIGFASQDADGALALRPRADRRSATAARSSGRTTRTATWPRIADQGAARLRQGGDPAELAGRRRHLRQVRHRPGRRDDGAGLSARAVGQPRRLPDPALGPRRLVPARRRRARSRPSCSTSASSPAIPAARCSVRRPTAAGRGETSAETPSSSPAC